MKHMLIMPNIIVIENFISTIHAKVAINFGMKIIFLDEISNWCETIGADLVDLKKIMSDHIISQQYRILNSQFWN